MSRVSLDDYAVRVVCDTSAVLDRLVQLAYDGDGNLRDIIPGQDVRSDETAERQHQIRWCATDR